MLLIWSEILCFWWAFVLLRQGGGELLNEYYMMKWLFIFPCQCLETWNALPSTVPALEPYGLWFWGLEFPEIIYYFTKLLFHRLEFLFAGVSGSFWGSCYGIYCLWEREHWRHRIFIIHKRTHKDMYTHFIISNKVCYNSYMYYCAM